MPPKRASAAKRPDLSVGGGGAFHTPHCPDGGSSLLESAQRRLEQAARDAFEREEGGSNDGSSSDDVPDDGSGVGDRASDGSASSGSSTCRVRVKKIC